MLDTFVKFSPFGSVERQDCGGETRRQRIPLRSRSRSMTCRHRARQAERDLTETMSHNNDVKNIPNNMSCVQLDQDLTIYVFKAHQLPEKNSRNELRIIVTDCSLRSRFSCSMTSTSHDEASQNSFLIARSGSQNKVREWNRYQHCNSYTDRVVGQKETQKHLLFGLGGSRAQAS